MKSKIKPNFKLLFEASPALYLVLLPDDPHFTIVAISDAVLKMIKVKRSQIVGKGLFDAFPENPLDPDAKGRENLIKSLRRVMEKKIVDVIEITRYDLKKTIGETEVYEEKYWSAFNSPVLDKNNEVAYIIHRSEDVTNYIKFKQKNSNIDEKMEYEMFSRERQLEEAHEQLLRSEENQKRLLGQLKELDKLKTQFFANVSHELRTPLTLILGPASKLLQEERLTDNGTHSLKVIVRNANTLLKHVTDLLDVAKLDENKMKPKYYESDIVAMAESIISNFDEAIKSKNIHFYFNAPDKLIAEYDTHMIQRVFLNLLSNAIKFTPQNGKIQFSITEEQRNVYIEIQDTGPGVPEEYQEVIFDRFRQLEEGAVRKYGGTGLGLSIAKEFVNLHRGKIYIKNAKGGGSVFTVCLPLHAPDNVIVARNLNGYLNKNDVIPFWGDLVNNNRPTTPVSTSIGQNELILVVEDNPDLNRFLVELLVPHYRVETAFDGEEGLEKAIRTKPNLILTDIMMPKMSGDQMIHKIQSHPHLKETLFVLLTAKADDFLKLQLLREGVHDYLVKPFLAEEVLSRIKNLLMLKRVADIMHIDSLLENAMDSVIGMDKNGIVTSWNSKAEVTFGWSKKEAIGKKMSELILPARYRGDHEKRLLQFQETGHGFVFNTLMEWTGIKKDGAEIPIELSITPVETKDSYIFYSFIRDISDRIKTLDDLRLARDAAESANLAKSAFLANMSHEIRTPLGAILGFSELVVDPSISAADKLSYIQAVKRNGDLLSNIINDILDLSRVEAGRLTIETREASVKEILSDVISALDLSATEKNISLSSQYADNVPRIIKTDPMRLRQILFNIVGNAVKFTKRGSVEVKVELIQNNNAPTKLAFIVKDTGLGISKEDEKKLFQPFSQADPSTTRQFGGTGLGLVLSKRLAKLLGGNIILTESKKGKGSTFMITIDPGPMTNYQVSYIDKKKSYQHRHNDSIRLDGLKVLLAEDSPDNMILISKLLKIAGAQVDTAENGKVALEKARNEEYDILLVDIQMPVMDGYQTLSELRKTGFRAPIIALTAHALKEDRLLSLASGFDDHIGKPVDRSLLLNSIANLTHRI